MRRWSDMGGRRGQRRILPARGGPGGLWSIGEAAGRLLMITRVDDLDGDLTRSTGLRGDDGQGGSAIARLGLLGGLTAEADDALRYEPRSGDRDWVPPVDRARRRIDLGDNRSGGDVVLALFRSGQNGLEDLLELLRSFTREHSREDGQGREAKRIRIVYIGRWEEAAPDDQIEDQAHGGPEEGQ